MSTLGPKKTEDEVKKFLKCEYVPMLGTVCYYEHVKGKLQKEASPPPSLPSSKGDAPSGEKSFHGFRLFR